MAIAGRIEYEISVDTTGLKKGLNDAKAETTSFASKVGNVAKSAGKALSGAMVAGATASAVAIGKIGKDAISAYADYQQLVGGVETLFKDSADAIFEYASKAYETAGISANKYMEQATSFSASLLQSLEGDTAKASQITDMAIKDMADNANKMGTALDSIQTAYQGFAKGQYMLLDNLKLGYGGTKTEMERLLSDATKITGVKYDINNLADVYSAIHVIQEQLEITGTTAKEASTTISGSASMMRSAWENLMVGIADSNADFNGLLDNLVKSVATFGKNILPVVKQTLKGIVNLIREIVPEIIAMLPELIAELLPAIIEATVSLMNALIENLPLILQALIDALPVFLNAIMQIIQGIIDNLPMFIEMIVQLVLGIVKILTSPENLKALLKAGITLFTAIIQAIPDIIVALIDALPDIISNIILFLIDPANIGMIVEAGVKLFMGLVMAIPRILGALFQAFGKLFADLWNGLKDMFQRFAGQFGEAISGVFKGAVNGVLWFIEGFINGPIDIINMFADGINWVLGGLTAGQVQIGKLNRISLPRLASGGIVESINGGRLILAGEGGQDEWVVPESKMADMIQKINEQGGTGGGITINIQGVFATSEAEQRAVAEQIHEKLQEINKSRMGAYL